MYELDPMIPMGMLRRQPARPDYRRSDRTGVAGSAWLLAGDVAARAQLLDLSQSGAQVATDLPMPLGGAVKLRGYLADGAEPFAALARVARVEPGDDGLVTLGLEFLGLTPKALDQLRRHFTRGHAIKRWSQQFAF